MHFIHFIFIGIFFSVQVNGQQIISKIAPEAQIAFLAEDYYSSEILRSYNSGILMKPGSVVKLVTTIAALELLGDDYQYSTKIYYNGTITNKILKGDLFVKGGADPSFGSQYFAQTAPQLVLKTIKEQLFEIGIEQLNGKIIIDQSEISEPRYPGFWLWEDMGNYFGAPPCGLTWRDNIFEIDLSSPDNAGELCKIVAIRPPLYGVEFITLVKSASNNKDSAYIYGYPGLKKWEIRGTIPKGKQSFTIKGANPNPASEFASELKTIFNSGNNEIDIVVTNQNLDFFLNKSVFITAINSPFLPEIVKIVNQQSNNLFADHIFLTLGKKFSADGENWSQSARMLSHYINEKKIKGPHIIYDGSGLSQKNLVSARFIVNLIKSTNNGNRLSVLESTLAVGGKSGTISRMWAQPEYNGRVAAKSGSMDSVLCYAGLITTRKNRKIAFCIMINNFTTTHAKLRKSIESEIGNLIDNY